MTNGCSLQSKSPKAEEDSSGFSFDKSSFLLVKLQRVKKLKEKKKKENQSAWEFCVFFRTLQNE